MEATGYCNGEVIDLIQLEALGRSNRSSTRSGARARSSWGSNSADSIVKRAGRICEGAACGLTGDLYDNLSDYLGLASLKTNLFSSFPSSRIDTMGESCHLNRLVND
jgi:hypothetical protein